MANPAVVVCAANQWTKVATSVTSGQLHLLSRAPSQYSHTYRDTGQAAPTDLSEAVVIDRVSIPISAPVNIDVYVYAHGVAGNVRVDL